MHCRQTGTAGKANGLLEVVENQRVFLIEEVVRFLVHLTPRLEECEAGGGGKPVLPFRIGRRPCAFLDHGDFLTSSPVWSIIFSTFS